MLEVVIRACRIAIFGFLLLPSVQAQAAATLHCEGYTTAYLDNDKQMPWGGFSVFTVEVGDDEIRMPRGLLEIPAIVTAGQNPHILYPLSYPLKIWSHPGDPAYRAGDSQHESAKKNGLFTHMKISRQSLKFSLSVVSEKWELWDKFSINRYLLDYKKFVINGQCYAGGRKI